MEYVEWKKKECGKVLLRVSGFILKGSMKKGVWRSCKWAKCIQENDCCKTEDKIVCCRER